MGKQTISNIKVGVFVIAGLLFLILLLYMIGRNENLFGSTFRLRARFSNVQGLTAGNNIRYAGIQVGTVKKVNILSDTLIEVVMLIETEMKKYIRKNAVVSIGTDGLMGNRVINIAPASEPARLVEENDLLPVKKTVDIEDMVQTLAQTNNDIAVIAAQMKKTIIRVNESTPLWEILNDKTLPQSIRHSLQNVQAASAKANQLISDLQTVVTDTKNGKGSLGAILTDTSIAVALRQALEKISQVGDDADSLALSLKKLTQNVQNDIDKGKGAVNTLFKDTLLTKNLQQTIENVRKGTEGFNTVMEGLKHNFLLRGYFRRMEKQSKKEHK